jgi:uncharacterized protein YjbJ (UPF0337 family)
MKTLAWLAAGVGVGLTAYLIMNAPAPQSATGYDDVEDAARSTTGWGTKQRAKGTGGSLLGQIEEGVGDLTGNEELSNRGVGDEIAGTAQKTVGKFAQAAGKTLHDLNR